MNFHLTSNSQQAENKKLLNRYNDSLVRDVITKINGIDRSWGLHYNSLYAVESTL